jgi:hypothetical protein
MLNNSQKYNVMIQSNNFGHFGQSTYSTGYGHNHNSAYYYKNINNSL